MLLQVEGNWGVQPRGSSYHNPQKEERSFRGRVVPASNVHPRFGLDFLGPGIDMLGIALGPIQSSACVYKVLLKPAPCLHIVNGYWSAVWQSKVG